MSRIADVQRKLGRRVGGGAEVAWQDARRDAAAARPVSTSLIAPGRETTIPTSCPQAITVQSRTSPPSFQRELASFVHRMFSPPPVGSGLTCVMFCSAEPDGAAAVTQGVADRLAAPPTTARIAVVRIASGATPTIAATDSATRVFTVTPGDAFYRVAELKAAFDYVLFDAQLAGSVPETLITASTTDGVVLVVNERTTHRRTAEEMVDLLKASGMRPMGVVLTDRSYPIPQSLYERL